MAARPKSAPARSTLCGSWPCPPDVLIMGKIDLGVGGSLSLDPNTAKEFSRDCTYDEVEETLRTISNSPSLEQGKKVAVVYGMGAQRSATYQSISSDGGVEVVGSRSLLRGAAALLRPFIASYEGVVRVTDPSRILYVFTRLMDKSMAALYCVEPERVGALVSQILHQKAEAPIDFGVKTDPGYLLYIVDADNEGSNTGIHEIVSFGIKTPRDLIPDRIAQQ